VGIDFSMLFVAAEGPVFHFRHLSTRLTIIEESLPNIARKPCTSLLHQKQKDRHQ
jgi:hypothetical protein